MGSAAHRAGGDDCPGGQVGPAGAYQYVSGVGSFGYGDQHEAGGGGGREVFGGVHGEVGSAVEYGGLYFFYEYSLAAHLVQGGGLVLVAGGFHHHGFDLNFGVGLGQ